MTTERKRQFIIDILFILTLVGIAYFVFKYLLIWLLPFLLAFAMAWLVQKPISLLSRRIHVSKKILSPILTFILVVIIIFIVSTLIYSAVLELIDLASKLPALYASEAPTVLANVTAWSEKILGDLPDEIEALLRGMITDASASIQSGLVSLSTWAIGAAATLASKVPSFLVAMLITVVATFFISSDYDTIKSFFRRQIPQKYRSFLSSSKSRFGNTLGKMAGSYAIIILLTFSELSLGFTILKLNHALLLAAIISIVDILPVLGVGTVLIPWGLIAMIAGDLPFGAKILGLYAIITVVRNFLEPKLIGDRIGLNPLVTMVFMYVGLRLMGLAGVFLFPLAIILVNDMQKSGMIHIWNDGANSPGEARAPEDMPEQ